MTENQAFSAEDWLTAQRRLWDQWVGFASQAMERAPQSGSTPFQGFQAGNPWFLAGEAGMPPEVQDFCRRAIEASKPYFEMAEHFTRFSEEGLNLHEVACNWGDRVAKTFGRVSGAGVDNNDALRDVMAFWDLPQDTWQRTFSALFPVPGDVFRALRPEGVTRMPGDVHGRLDQFLSAPALGYTRESQEKYQKLGRLMLEYQKALHAYNVAMSKVNLEAVELFHRKLHQTSESGAEITTLKELYTLWVDACEEVYAQYATSEPYARMYGELVNSLMAVKRQTTKVVDEYFESLNMPTRKEINTLHKRMQAMRRDYNRLTNERIEDMQEELAAFSTLREEISALRVEMAALKKQGADKGAGKAPAPSSAGKKGK